MAQAGYTPISLYYSTTASAAPTAGNLASGELAINITDGKLYYKDNGGVVQLIASKAGASGSVTSVAQSFTGGLISVSGSPITTSGTLALTVAGTSGGVPYFSSASTWASSAALAANALVVGGGAGAAPATITTGTGVVTALGVNTGSAGAFVVNGGALGTPSSGTLSSCTGLPISTGVSGLGTGVATALAVNVGTAGAFVVNGGALGTPSSGTLSSCTGLPVSTGISGLGTGVATALAVNVGTAGAFVVNGGALGTPSSGTLTNATGLPLTSGVTGTLPVANGGTGVTTSTGSGSNVLSTSPTLVTPILGTPTSGNLNNCTADGTNAVGYRNIPQNSQTSAYVLVAGDVGKHISITTGGVTCNASVFSAGDVVSIYNNSGSNQTITAGTNVTFRLAGSATTGNRTLAQYGVATLLCIVGGATPTFVVTGNVT